MTTLLYFSRLLFENLSEFSSFCADKKKQKALRMDAFLTASEADGFWGCGTTVPASETQVYLQSFKASAAGGGRSQPATTLKQSSPFSKNHWRRLPKSLMRTNEAMNLSMNNT